DHRVDLYSVGCVAYWMLTGQLVFEGESPMNIVMEHVHAKPIPPSQRTEVEVPGDLEDIVLSCLAKPGRENLEDWKAILRGLIERGLRRVMIFVQDDFSGLLKVSESFFPNADVQLCVVHMQRNAKNHLSKSDAAEFQQRFRAIKTSWSEEVGNRGFEDLCDRFDDDYPSWISELRRKRLHYLAFLKYPDAIRKSFSTTNQVEAVNGQLEIVRRNSGGYFHSEDTLKFKLSLAVSHLHNGKWKSPARTIHSALHQLKAQFQARFEEAI
ncbi:MAG: transposase, partial [Acidobacteria bacterium]|nr:transposase [Acidobacteriota bacterium]